MTKRTQLPPKRIDVELKQGDEYAYNETAEDDGGTNVDFSNHTDEILTVYDSENKDKVLTTYSTADGDLTTTSSGGVEATFTEADTDTWSPSSYYSFESEDGSGKTRTWIEGRIIARE